MLALSALLFSLGSAYHAPSLTPWSRATPSLTPLQLRPLCRHRACVVTLSEASSIGDAEFVQGAPPAVAPAYWNGLPLKWCVLLLLVVQNAATTMLVRATRTPRPAALGGGGPLYLASAAVLISECIKLPTCLFLIVRDEDGSIKRAAQKVKSVLTNVGDTLRMGVPAVCYGLQNALFFVALSNLSATTYQLWSQTKTLFTAFFFVKILGQRLRTRQWVALGLLTAGVGLVQLEEVASAAPIGTAALRIPIGATWSRSALTFSAITSNAAVGVLAVLASSLLSGFANIYFEKVLKQAECEFDDSCDLDGARTEAMSLWLRNVQLAIFSIPQAAILLLASSRSRAVIAEYGVLAGFTPAVWCVTVLTAGGGLLIAAVVKYADNVLKTYATAVAIVLTCIINTAVVGTPPTIGFMQGMGLVLISMLLYNGALSFRSIGGLVGRRIRRSD